MKKTTGEMEKKRKTTGDDNYTTRIQTNLGVYLNNLFYRENSVIILSNKLLMD